MNLRLVFIYTTIIIFILNGCFSNSGINVPQHAYEFICGVWNDKKSSNSYEELSWGKAKILVNSSLIFDLGHDTPYLQIGPWMTCKIKKIVYNDKTYIITIEMIDKKEYVIEVQKLNSRTMIINQKGWIKEIPYLNNRNEKENKFYKIDGPNIKYYSPTIENLRLRSEPIIGNNSIRLLNKDERLLFVKNGKSAVINSHSGTWIKVITENGQYGWCFDYYLKNK